MRTGTGMLSAVAVDTVPVLLGRPEAAADRHRLALWLPFFTGTKESAAPVLESLVRRGFTALSLDPWQHGERAVSPMAELSERVFAQFRRGMWPILGQTTLDAIRVIDWALERFDVSQDGVVAGGVSMGGDIAVALAGADPRVARVAAVVATPDWTRPGMTALDDPTATLDQGAPSGYGRWLYERLNPMTNQAAYAHGPVICFELGAEDTHVPPASAFAFRSALVDTAGLAASRMRVTAHPGLDHLGASRDERVLTAAIEWLLTE
ncbi:alpha/beta hydrolase family protein [Propionicimonas sp.]|uniref:alpha/beta hydrolase family protein n=1 Tax=Propionicimonas sp. TaxID=1955623 RepID=UPI0039E6FAA1